MFLRVWKWHGTRSLSGLNRRRDGHVPKSRKHLNFLPGFAAVVFLLGSPMWGGNPTVPAAVDPALHVVVFEDYPYTTSAADPEPYQAVDLPSAEFPELFSCRYAPFHKLQHVSLPESVEIPRKLLLLDIHTFPKRDLERNDTTLRNAFTNLTYQLKLENWGDDSYQMTLQGEFKGFRFKDVSIKGSLRSTMLITIRKTSRQTLFAAITPVAAIPLFRRDTVDRGPQLIEGPSPRSPAGLLRPSRVQIRGIITAEGRLDSEHFVLLECPHPRLARLALDTILDRWRFAPAVQDGEQVEGLTTIEIEFLPD